MAPSRALLARRIFAIAQPHIRPTSRLPTRTLLVSSCNRTSSALPHGPSYPTTSPAFCTRSYSQQATTTPEPPEYLNEAELHIFNKIKDRLDPVKLEVQDVSGGCGSMYAIEIESPKFKGLTPVKQHKLVNEVLKEEIAQWHGVQLRLKAV